MKKILFLLFIILITKLSFSQSITFEKWYDYGFAESGHCVQQTSDGGYIVAGRQGIGFGSSNYLLVKTDSLGNEQWHRSFGSPGDNELNAIKQTFDGGYIVTGQTSGTQPGRYDISWIKLNSIGNTVWNKRLTPPPDEYYGYGKDVLQTVDSGYLILANIIDSDSLGASLLIKTNSIGDTLWVKKFKCLAGIKSYSLKQTFDTGYIIAGSVTLTPNAPFYFNVYLIKTNANGDTLWTKIQSTSNNYEAASNIIETAVGEYFIRGSISYLSNSAVFINIRSANNFGDTLWTKNIGSGAESGTGADKMVNGGFIISGATDVNNVTYLFLAAVDDFGDSLWARTFGSGVMSGGGDGGTFVHSTSDSGFIITGIRGVSSAVYLIKTNSLGNVVISVDELQPEENSIVVYPNPFSNESTVLLPEKIKNKNEVELRLQDMLGRTVAETKFNPSLGSITLHRNKLVAGVYLLRLFSEKELIASKKIIIQ